MKFYEDQNTTDDMDMTIHIQQVIGQRILENNILSAGEESVYVVRKRRLRRGRAIAATAVANVIARNCPRT